MSAMQASSAEAALSALQLNGEAADDASAATDGSDSAANTASPGSAANGFSADEKGASSNSSPLTTESGELVVTPDPTDFSIKHPLHTKWTMWFDAPPAQGKASQRNWSDNLKQIVTVETVEDFWCLYNNLVQPDQLLSGSNYHFFKEGIRPEWEDSANRHGGKWVISLTRDLRNKINDLWMYLLLGLIGEALTDADEVCGGVVSLRKTDRITLWIKTPAHSEHVIKRIGTQLKQILELPDSITLGFQMHSDALRRNASFNNRNLFEL